MASSATRGLLAGLGKGLAVVGEKGLDNHYEQLRMKKAQEYKLESMAVDNEYSTAHQERGFGHDVTMQSNSQAHDVEQANIDHERKSGLLTREIEARSAEAEKTRTHQSAENTKDRELSLQQNKSKATSDQAGYFKNMLKLKSDELRDLTKDFTPDPENSPMEYKRMIALQREVKSLTKSYQEAVGLKTGASDPDDRKERLIKIFMRHNPGKTRDYAIDHLSQHPKYSRHFQ